MGNKLVTIVTTLVTLIMFMALVAFLSADTQLDQSKKIVEDFAETIQYKGYITQDQYRHVLNEIPYSNIKLNITHIKRDSYNNGVDTGYAPGTLDMRFTDSIIKEMVANTAEGGIYKFKVGDEVQIDLMVMESSFFDAIASMVTGRASSAIKTVTSESGVILNEKYLEDEAEDGTT